MSSLPGDKWQHVPQGYRGISSQPGVYRIRTGLTNSVSKNFFFWGGGIVEPLHTDQSKQKMGSVSESKRNVPVNCSKYITFQLNIIRFFYYLQQSALMWRVWRDRDAAYWRWDRGTEHLKRVKNLSDQQKIILYSLHIFKRYRYGQGRIQDLGGGGGGWLRP